MDLKPDLDSQFNPFPHTFTHLYCVAERHAQFDLYRSADLNKHHATHGHGNSHIYADLNANTRQFTDLHAWPVVYSRTGGPGW